MINKRKNLSGQSHKGGRMRQNKLYKEVIVSNFLDGSENLYNKITHQYSKIF